MNADVIKVLTTNRNVMYEDSGPVDALSIDKITWIIS